MGRDGEQVMNSLLDVIQQVFVRGQITAQDEAMIKELLWVTPMNDRLRYSLQLLEKGIESGTITLNSHHYFINS